MIDGSRETRRRTTAWPIGLLSLAALAGSGSPSIEAAEGSAFRCVAGEVRGVEPADAQTAIELVCDAIRATDAAGTFSVSLRSLGHDIILSAARDQGAPVTATLSGIEEAQTAAARLAAAVVDKHALPTTQRIDNLLETETREPLSKKGSVRFSTGVNGFTPLGHGGSGAGFSLGLIYAAPTVALPVDMRFAWNESSDGSPSASLFAISVGGRRYFSRRDLSPFAGAGFSMLRLSAEEGHYDSGRFEGTRFGFAPYLEGGIEILRLHRARLAFGLRLDVPTGSLRSDGASDYYGQPTRPPSSRYVMPLSAGATIAF
jgi:hypothetical protein